jgi:hypothetical protein
MVTESGESRKSWVQRFDAWVRRTPTWLLLVLLASLISAIGTVTQCADDVHAKYEERFNWREKEYKIIQSLHSGTNIAIFDAKLGAPLFVRQSQDKRYIEKSYKRHGYWIQAIHNEFGMVELWAVTACQLDFTPTIRLPGSSVQLNRTSFAATGMTPTYISYSTSGATATNYYFDFAYGANPGYYKEYIFGINESCPDIARISGHGNPVDTIGTGPLTFQDLPFRDVPRGPNDPPPSALGVKFDASDEQVQKFRRLAIMNTYAESGPVSTVTNWPALIQEFGIGVDRLLVRTIP